MIKVRNINIISMIKKLEKKYYSKYIKRSILKKENSFVNGLMKNRFDMMKTVIFYEQKNNYERINKKIRINSCIIQESILINQY